MNELKNYFKVALKSVDWKPSITEVSYQWADWQTYKWLQFEWYASTKDKDRWGDIVLPSAFESCLNTYMENPIIFLQHDSNRPIGSMIEATIDDKWLYVKGIVKSDKDNIFQDLRTGVIKTMSFGYRVPRDWYTQIETTKPDGTKEIANEITNLELFEISLVSVPMNPKAQVKSKDTLVWLSDEKYIEYFQINKKDEYSLAKSVKDLFEKLKDINEKVEQEKVEETIVDKIDYEEIKTEIEEEKIEEKAEEVEEKEEEKIEDTPEIEGKASWDVEEEVIEEDKNEEVVETPTDEEKIEDTEEKKDEEVEEAKIEDKETEEVVEEVKEVEEEKVEEKIEEAVIEEKEEVKEEVEETKDVDWDDDEWDSEDEFDTVIGAEEESSKEYTNKLHNMSATELQKEKNVVYAKYQQRTNMTKAECETHKANCNKEEYVDWNIELKGKNKLDWTIKDCTHAMKMVSIIKRCKAIEVDSEDEKACSKKEITLMDCAHDIKKSKKSIELKSMDNVDIQVGMVISYRMICDWRLNEDWSQCCYPSMEDDAYIGVIKEIRTEWTVVWYEFMQASIENPILTVNNYEIVNNQLVQTTRYIVEEKDDFLIEWQFNTDWYEVKGEAIEQIKDIETAEIPETIAWDSDTTTDTKIEAENAEIPKWEEEEEKGKENIEEKSLEMQWKSFEDLIAKYSTIEEAIQSMATLEDIKSVKAEFETLWKEFKTFMNETVESMKFCVEIVTDLKAKFRNIIVKSASHYVVDNKKEEDVLNEIKEKMKDNPLAQQIIAMKQKGQL